MLLDWVYLDTIRVKEPRELISYLVGRGVEDLCREIHTLNALKIELGDYKDKLLKGLQSVVFLPPEFPPHLSLEDYCVIARTPDVSVEDCTRYGFNLISYFRNINNIMAKFPIKEMFTNIWHDISFKDVLYKIDEADELINKINHLVDMCNTIRGGNEFLYGGNWVLKLENGVYSVGRKRKQKSDYQQKLSAALNFLMKEMPCRLKPGDEDKCKKVLESLNELKDNVQDTGSETGDVKIVK